MRPPIVRLSLSLIINSLLLRPPARWLPLKLFIPCALLIIFLPAAAAAVVVVLVLPIRPWPCQFCYHQTESNFILQQPPRSVAID